MPQCRVLSTYGRHRQRKVSLVDWSQCVDNSRNVSLFSSGEGEALMSTSTHAMCLRNRSKEEALKVDYGSDQFYSDDPDSYAEEIYGSNEKDNQRSHVSRKGKAKNKTQKNTKSNTASKTEKKPKLAKSEKPTVELAEAFDSTKTGYRNRKKKKKTVGGLEDENERLCTVVNFSDIEKHSLIISDSPPIETDLQPVVTTPKKTNWNPCSAVGEHQEQQLPVNASPIPVHCSTPHVDGLPTNSCWAEKEKLKMPTELYDNVSLISNCMSHIQLSETNCSLLSNQDVNKDGRNAVNCSNLSGFSHSDTSSLLRDYSLSQSSAKCDWSSTSHQGSDLSTALPRVDYNQAELPPGRTNVRKQGNRSFAEMSSSELFSVSGGDHSPKDKLRSFDVSCVTDLRDVEPEEDASMREELVAEDVRSSESEADDDVDMEDDEELLSSSSCLSRILEEDETENYSPKIEHMASTSCVISHRESGYRDASSVLSTISCNQLQLTSESPQMLFTPKVQKDLAPERAPSLRQHHQDGTPHRMHSSSDAAVVCRENGFLTPRVKMPAYFQQALQKSARSIKEMLTPIRLPQLDRVPTFAEKVLSQCEQTQPCSFATVLPARVLKTCVKIGEGVYGEVFRVKQNGENIALKIIPIEGLQLVNGEKQKTFEEILPEIVITKELSSLRHSELYRTENFVHVKRVSLVQGTYPKNLIDQWDKYDSAVGSENDRPDKFSKDQLFILFAFEDSGSNLESVELTDLGVVCSIITQVCMSLAIAERSLEFEHRDLHWGNVLVKPTDQMAITYILDDETKEVATNGLKVTIIDFTLSRLRGDCTVFTDLSSDETLFTGKGDYQFEIYRLMKEETGNDWEPHRPFTNVLWIHYLMDKLVNCKDYRDGKNPQLLRQSRGLLRSILNYESAADLVSHCSFFHDK